MPYGISAVWSRSSSGSACSSNSGISGSWRVERAAVAATNPLHLPLRVPLQSGEPWPAIRQAGPAGAGATAHSAGPAPGQADGRAVQRSGAGRRHGQGVAYRSVSGRAGERQVHESLLNRSLYSPLRSHSTHPSRLLV